MISIRIIPGLAATCLLLWTSDAYAERPFDIEAYLSLKDISELTVSPDGAFLAYTVTVNDLDSDKSASAVWMQPTAGGGPVRMTEPDSNAWSPQWSPDNRYLGVLSDRNGVASQVWLLDRRGGDASQLTDISQGVSSYQWSPDGGRILLLARDPSPDDDRKDPPNPPPYVIDRLQFKRDYVGYLDDRRSHVHVMDIATRNVRQVTFGDYDDSQAVWSPDGEHLVFVSNRSDWPDTNRNTDLWRIDANANDARPEPLTRAHYADANPVISADGKRIAYTSSVSDGLPVYAIPQLAILDTETGESAPVMSLAEVQVWGLRFSPDGRSLYAITEYRGEQQLVAVDLRSGSVERIVAGENVVHEFDLGPDEQVYAVVSRPQAAAEVYRVNPGDASLEPLSAINADLMANVATGRMEKHTYIADDGTPLDTFVVFPPDYEKGKRYPAVLHLHGGPWAQWDWRFDSESQLFASRGYVVVMPNFRGSWGYGQAFTDALVGKWGDIDYRDSMNAVDFAIDSGWIDGNRLAVYGWSWGGFLTNHVITKTDRFRAAISGASETLVAANYGHDEWQRLWEEELGFPWLAENRDRWDRVSPFYSLDQVTTPTLVVCGEDDWNMPVQNSEQLFIALKRRGVPTQLIVYPEQGHSLSVPSYERDLYRRYFDWIGRYLDE